MKNRIKLPSIGAFNAGSGSLFALRPQPHRLQDSKQQYQPLTVWEQLNNRTRKEESRRLIRQNILLAVKFKGKWWVALNPNCEDQLADL